MTDGQQCTGGYNIYRGPAESGGPKWLANHGNRESHEVQACTHSHSIRITQPPTECIYGTLCALKHLANSSVTSRWIYSAVIPTLGMGWWWEECITPVQASNRCALWPDHVIQHAHMDRHLAARVLPDHPHHRRPHCDWWPGRRGAEYFSFDSGDVLTTVVTLHAAYVG